MKQILFERVIPVSGMQLENMWKEYLLIQTVEIKS